MRAGDRAPLGPHDVHLLAHARDHGQVVREVARHDARDPLAALAQRLARAAMLLTLAVEGFL